MDISDELTPVTAKKLLTALMHSHGFSTSPEAQPWWVRVVKGADGQDVRQLVRTVLWGLGAKSNPHLLVQTLADDAAVESVSAGEPVRIPLTPRWDEVEAEFERVVIPKLALWVSHDATSGTDAP